MNAPTISILTPTAITREALRVLHQKLNFVGTITREYDDSFARQGAKVGDTLKVHLPGAYAVRSGGFGGASFAEQTDHLVKASAQLGAEAVFTTADLAANIDEFSDRILEPAMAGLAAKIEGNAVGLYRDIYNQVDGHGQPTSFSKVLQARKILVDNLAPLNGRTCNLREQDSRDLSDALKGLFNDRATITKQNREGFMGRTAGFDFMTGAPWPLHDRGTAEGWAVDGANQHGAVLRVTGARGRAAAGDTFTIPGVNRAHPETKADTGVPQQFVVLEDCDGGTLAFAPAIVTIGAGQNVTYAPRDGEGIVWAGKPGQPHGISMAYQKGAFAFASADMVMPRGVDFAAREAFDGISLRLVRQYDINEGRYPCRFDLLLGRATLRPQLACRIAAN